MLVESLANQLGLERFHWLGTSMDGAIGTRAAATSLRGRIRRLMLNDSGPELANVRPTSAAAPTPAFRPNLLCDTWDSLDVPVLCLRGESSDLLLADTTEQMRQRGPRAVVVTIAGCGHAPTLNTPEHCAIVERILAGA